MKKTHDSPKRNPRLQSCFSKLRRLIRLSNRKGLRIYSEPMYTEYIIVYSAYMYIYNVYIYNVYIYSIYILYKLYKEQNQYKLHLPWGRPSPSSCQGPAAQLCSKGTLTNSQSQAWYRLKPRVVKLKRTQYTQEDQHGA